jgi:hypothetical protein
MEDEKNPKDSSISDGFKKFSAEIEEFHQDVEMEKGDISRPSIIFSSSTTGWRSRIHQDMGDENADGHKSRTGDGRSSTGYISVL